MRKTTFAFIAASGTFFVSHAIAQDKSIIVASTTSTVDTGLFDYLLPIFTQKTGIAVKVLELGTGRALDAGRRGEADVVFVHARIPEIQFVIEGNGVKRFPVMYNDFVLIGPKSDPAGIKGMNDVAKAFRTIKDKQETFISRGDRSGTHLAELATWYRDVGIDIENEKGPWYKSVGQGMDEALGQAVVDKGYVLSDRSTWIHFKNKSDLRILVEGDKRMFNQYAVILVNPGKHPNVRGSLDKRSSTGWCRQRDREQSPTIRLMASSCSFLTPPIPRLENGTRSGATFTGSRYGHSKRGAIACDLVTCSTA